MLREDVILADQMWDVVVGRKLVSPARRGERDAAAPASFCRGPGNGFVCRHRRNEAVMNSAAGCPLPVLEYFSSAEATSWCFSDWCRHCHFVLRDVFLEVFKIRRFQL